MNYVKVEVIQGVSVGFEYINKDDLGEPFDGWYLVVDLFIIRILFERTK
jgi:hypothetical protein